MRIDINITVYQAPERLTLWLTINQQLCTDLNDIDGLGNAAGFDVDYDEFLVVGGHVWGANLVEALII
ncbi:hypothetical protein N9251_01095 [Gammaproteobacteria bacterium]|nr:hypothetical protein [Gammaproteobacteria bacterium]